MVLSKDLKIKINNMEDKNINESLNKASKSYRTWEDSRAILKKISSYKFWW
jgi:hypothetical protein